MIAGWVVGAFFAFGGGLILPRRQVQLPDLGPRGHRMVATGAATAVAATLLT